jgi:hypothetical protein
MATTMGATSSCDTIKTKSEAVTEAAVSAAREASMEASTGIVIEASKKQLVNSNRDFSSFS